MSAAGKRGASAGRAGKNRAARRWLLQAHDSVDGNLIPLTQEFLAQMLGVRRTTVTIAARLLQRAGLIRYRRGHIQIVARPTLEELSCECYAAVRRYTDNIFPPSVGT
jgi:Crp-like helix-turn-helix domain